MTRNRVPTGLRQKLLKKMPERTLNWRIKKKLVDLNGVISRRAAAFLVAKDQKVDFTRYVTDEDRQEMLQVTNIRLQVDDTIKSRTIEREVVKEIKPLKKVSAFEPFVPSALLEEATEMAEKVYPLLYVFENSVRNVIKILMEKQYSPNWWDVRIKNTQISRIDDDVEKRMNKEKQERWHTSKRGVHKIYYTDIDDLQKIIQDNWKVFRKIHQRQSWVTEHIMQLSYSRNIIAHNNPLKKRDIQSIETKILEWFDQIRGLSI